MLNRCWSSRRDRDSANICRDSGHAELSHASGGPTSFRPAPPVRAERFQESMLFQCGPPVWRISPGQSPRFSPSEFEKACFSITLSLDLRLSEKDSRSHFSEVPDRPISSCDNWRATAQPPTGRVPHRSHFDRGSSASPAQRRPGSTATGSPGRQRPRGFIISILWREFAR